jgi:glyoxylase-like metal-dependent hydrolase (beta-lactamase superfamily II)
VRTSTRVRTLSRLAVAAACALAIAVLAPGVRGQGRAPGARGQAGSGGVREEPNTPAEIIARAAEALGGRNRVLNANTLILEGYGQLAYQNGGGNITSSPDAPQKWIDVNDHRREIDLRTGRMVVRQKQVNDFVFAAAQGMRGTVSQQGVEGDVAFNIAGSGSGAKVTRASEAAARTRRMDMLAHPLTVVRAALDSAARLGNRRTEDGLTLVDVTTRLGDLLTLAVDANGLPAWVRWIGPDQNLGNLTYRAAFTGYQPVNGLRLPTGFNTTIDFRDIVQSKLYVDRQAVNAPLTALALPDAVRKAPAPVPPVPVIESTEIAKGIWYLRGQGNSTLFEFADHLTLYEAYGSEANARAIFEKARSLVPGKPLTQVIVSHHHFDHTGGLRAAVAEGLTIVTQAGNAALFREMASRPTRLFPDALGRTPKPIQILAVDDHLKMRDANMEIDIYRVVANSHMADGLLVHVPRDRLLVQGDLFDVSWEIYWWGSSYEDNIRYRKLQVERDVPVHGRVAPIAEVQALIKKQIAAAQALCTSVDAAGLTMRGCPVKETVDR